MKAQIADFQYIDSRHGRVVLDIDGDFRGQYDKFKDKDIEVSIKKWHPSRSLDSNRLLWELCTQIAKVIGSTKEDVYKQAIRGYGEYTSLLIKEEAVLDFERNWSEHGIGWFIDVVDDSDIPGYKLIFAYQGSSTYDTAQMSRLIENSVMQDARALGIETRNPEEIQSLLKEER